MKQSIVAIVATVVLAGGALAAQQAPPTAAKPEAAKAAPASLAGKWTGAVETPNGNLALVLDVKIDADNKVTGTLTGDNGPAPIKGEVKEGTLTFTFGYDAGGGPIQVAFEGRVKADGKLAGTMNAGEVGSFPFTAERAKGL
jgi:hypothetical protein